MLQGDQDKRQMGEWPNRAGVMAAAGRKPPLFDSWTVLLLRGKWDRYFCWTALFDIMSAVRVRRVVHRLATSGSPGAPSKLRVLSCASWLARLGAFDWVNGVAEHRLCTFPGSG